MRKKPGLTIPDEDENKSTARMRILEAPRNATKSNSVLPLPLPLGAESTIGKTGSGNAYGSPLSDTDTITGGKTPRLSQRQPIEIESIDTALPKKKKIREINFDTVTKELSTNSTALNLLQSGTTTTVVSPGLRQRPKAIGIPGSLNLVPCGESPRLKRAQSIKDPSDQLTERSKIYNFFFGLFFAASSFGFGYQYAVMGPLGEKFMRFHFGVIENAALYLGLTNLTWALGSLVGAAVASSIAQKIGPIRSLFYMEILQAAFQAGMMINNIQLFLA